MPLPVLPARRSDADLLRLFCRTELLRSDPLAEQTPLQSGTALTNSGLPTIAAANRMLDAAIPAGWSAEQALAEVSAHFAALGVRCLEWWPNLSQASDPLAAALLAAGYSARPIDVLCLPSPARPPLPGDRPGSTLSVYSARAAIGQARALAEEMAGSEAEAFLLHLDNANYELLLASQSGEPVGMVGILSAGDLGRIDPLFVRPAHRRRGIGRLLLDRAIELAARSRFADVLAAPPSAAAPFFTTAGFRPVGQLKVYEMDFV